MRYWLIIFAIAVLVPVGMVSAPTGAFALTFTPERIDTEVYPGVSQTEKLTLLNETGTSISVVLYPVELDLSQAEVGRASFLLDTAGSSSVAWISVTPPQMVLGPGEVRDVQLTLTAPETSSGSLTAGIVTKFRPVSSGEEGDIALMAVTGPFVFARVLSDSSVMSGKILALHFAEGTRVVSHIPDTVEVSFANTGSVHLTPMGTIDVRDIFGRTVDRYVVNRDKALVLPGTTRTLRADWEGAVTAAEEPSSNFAREWRPFRLGPYTYTATVSFGDNVASNTERIALVIPWRSLVFLGVILVGIVVARRRLQKVQLPSV